jgi:glycosyltransferase involved in cell wall biosynthesis
MPKVSVIIPSYNSMTYLPATVDSVLKQTFTDFEVLIINDGSTDNILEWASKIEDTRVKVITKTNQGLAEARNTGIALAKGEYLAFLDADDLWHKTKLEKQVNYLNNHPDVGLVDTWVALTDENAKPTGTLIKTNAEGKVIKKILESPTIVCGSSPLVRNICFEKAGLFNKQLSGSADWDMWIRIANHFMFGLIKEPLTYYRQHYNSMSQNRQKMLDDNLAVIERAFANVSPELNYIKNRSYGRVNLYLAWRAIDQKNYGEAITFRRKALSYYPRLRFSKNYINQTIGLIIMEIFGSEAIEYFRNITRNIRRKFFPIKA